MMFAKAAERLLALFDAGHLEPESFRAETRRLRRREQRHSKREAHYANRRFSNEDARRRRQIAAGSLKRENGLDVGHG